MDLDDYKGPKSVPPLASWATPAGWREGLRPRCAGESAENGGGGQHNGHDRVADGNLLREIEGMEKAVGKRMYRGILKSVARVWNPKDIQEKAIQEKVLAHMQAAERGLRRADAAREKAGLDAFARILGSVRLNSLPQVDNLKTLQEIVIELEGGNIP